ncbi:MAG: pitrilysin family protein [Candidatus Omnitrophota bacterium]
MRNRANVKEEKEKGKDNSFINHGELGLKRYSLWFLIFAVIICSGHAVVSAEDSLGKTHYEVLDNGMTVFLKENNRAPLAHVFLCVFSGSAQEGTLAGHGIAHYIEHMLFKGTTRRPAGKIFQEVESYGGRINGFTSYDYTGFTITVPAKFIYPALDILADMASNAVFDEKELGKERQVILKEIKLGEDSPDRRISRLLWQTAFSTHIYKYPIIGEQQLFEKLTRDNLVKFYRQNYAANNMAVVVAGNIELPAVREYVKELYQHIPANPALNLASVSEPKQSQRREQQIRFTTGLTYLMLGYHSVALTDEDCFALDVLASILGDGRSSRLYDSICSKKKQAYSIETTNYTPRYPGLFIISALLEEKNKEPVTSLILDQIRRIKKTGVLENDLERAKNKIASSIIFYQQTLEGLAQNIASDIALTADPLYTEKYLAQINRVSAQDVQRAAEKYLTEENLSIAALVPRKGADSVIKTENIQPKSIQMGREHLSEDALLDAALPPAAAKETLSVNYTETLKIKKYVLNNGITLLVQEDKQLPLVSIKAVFKGGLRVEQEYNNGVCDLTAKMLERGGTRTRTSAEIACIVDSKGAELSSFSGNNSFGLSINLLSKDKNEMLELLADLIMNSSFPSGEFKKERKENLAELKTVQDDIFAYGTKALKESLFLKHPYRFLSIGSEKSLKNLARRDLINFYHQFCAGTNLVLAVFGDVDAEEVYHDVQRLFSGLLPAELPPGIPVEDSGANTARTNFIPVSKEQSLVLMGFKGTTVNSADRFPLEIISQLLSQSSGRLFTQIREKAAAAYTLGSYSVLGIDPGYLVVYAATTAENVERVKTELTNQLNSLKETLIAPEELEQAKTVILGERLMDRQTNSACAMESALDELYGLGYDHYAKYEDKIRGVTSEDIARAAKKYFDFSNYSLVVAGPE